jgi:hypothetical protein
MKFVKFELDRNFEIVGATSWFIILTFKSSDYQHWVFFLGMEFIKEVKRQAQFKCIFLYFVYLFFEKQSMVAILYVYLFSMKKLGFKLLIFKITNNDLE